MKTRTFRILGAAMAALLPACGGGGGGGSGGGSGNRASPVTLQKPAAGQSFTAPATITLSAAVADPGSVAKVEFTEVHLPLGPAVVATSTQPPFQATWTDVQSGIHTLVAVVTDTLGAQTTSPSVTINVLPPGTSLGGWVPIANVSGSFGGPVAMWFVDANRGWIAGHHDTILHTEDGGATWVAQLGGVQGGTRVPGVGKIQFVDGDRGWAVEGDTVLRTTDGGATWTRNSTGTDANLFDLSFVDSDTGWVVGTVGNVFSTNDGGVTWTPLPTGIPGNDFNYAVQFVDRLNGWALGTVQTQGGEFPSVILHTTDGGLTWTEQFRAELGQNVQALDFVSATTGWVSRTGALLMNEGILFTSDGGATWTEQTYSDRDGIIALDFVSSKQGWGVGPTGAIIHTEDGGRSWETQQSSNIVTPPLVSFNDVHFIDANRGWALRGDGILLKTTTGGKAP